MQITTPGIVLLLVLAVFPRATVCAPQPTVRSKPRPIEVWRTGDDALTSRLRDALEDALASHDFALSSGKKPGTLIVMIPTHVKWKPTKGGRTEVYYTVEFSSVDTGTVDRSSGSCWDDSLSACAARIVKDAKVASRKIR